MEFQPIRKSGVKTRDRRGIKQLVWSVYDYNGYMRKATNSRLVILDLLKREIIPLSAAQIRDCINKSELEILNAKKIKEIGRTSTASVYRCLKLLIEMGEVRRIQGKPALYELDIGQ